MSPLDWCALNQFPAEIMMPVFKLNKPFNDGVNGVRGTVSGTYYILQRVSITVLLRPLLISIVDVTR